MAITSKRNPAAEPPSELEGESIVEGGRMTLEKGAAADMPQVPPPAAVAALPEIEQKRFFLVFPSMAPKPAPDHPGVFLNEDGSTYIQPTRDGGQFSCLCVEFENKYDPARTRKMVLPLYTDPNSYGKRKEERIIKRTEVVFDTAEQRDDCLRAFGHKLTGDPLKASLEQKGLGEAFDSTQTTPSYR